MNLLALSLACAAFVAPDTILQIIHTESGGNPLAVHVNNLPANEILPPAQTPKQAIKIVSSYLARGYTVDIGLMQLNSRNLPRFHLSLTQALDPCINIRTGALILTDDYLRTAQKSGYGRQAFLDALSAYNSGNFREGFRNGYVARYRGASPLPFVTSPLWNPSQRHYSISPVHFQILHLY